jgi:uncharacterized protein
VTPSLERILETVRAASPASTSPIHGDDHWRRVAALGLALAATDPAVDAELVVLFGITHDAKRTGDGFDLVHGPEAARYVRRLDLGLSADRLELLTSALAEHSDGWTTSDPTIGACWDADRLDLYRLGRVPRDDLLSTREARTPALRGRARRFLRFAPTWPDIFMDLAALGRDPTIAGLPEVTAPVDAL